LCAMPPNLGCPNLQVGKLDPSNDA
jgi:hypothetical protein